MTVGLGQAMWKLGKKSIIALREPSLGPVFGIKGGAAGGGWSQVRIGGADSGVGGYMMTQYLSADGAGVKDATYDRRVVSPYGTQSVVLRDRPSDSYAAVAMLTVGETVRVLGTSGSYYYVRTSSACVGCLSDDELD